jgi:hypothetical protein
MIIPQKAWFNIGFVNFGGPSYRAIRRNGKAELDDFPVSPWLLLVHPRIGLRESFDAGKSG